MEPAVKVESAANEADFVTVKTTLPAEPLPPNATRPVVTTERLLLRPMCQDDFDALRVLRTQEEVMRWTHVGHVDLNASETQAKLDAYLPPKDVRTYNFAICLRETGELIGTGGCLGLHCEFGWPEVGYMFRREYWGIGLATEFLRAFLAVWSGLPRVETEFRVDPRTVTGDDGVCEEQLIAITDRSNLKSRAVLEKCGFELLLTFEGGKLGEEFEGVVIQLPTFRFFPSRTSEA